MLLQASFPGLLVGSLVTEFVDNDGVCLEVTCFVFVYWLRAAKERCDYVFHRVESVSDIADGPTRPDKVGCALLHALHAVETPALLQGFLVALWFPLASDVLLQDVILVRRTEYQGSQGLDVVALATASTELAWL